MIAPLLLMFSSAFAGMGDGSGTGDAPAVTAGAGGLAPDESALQAPSAPDPRRLIENMIDLTRGLSSFAVFQMHIRRPDWQRTSSLRAWTRGREDALIVFTGPARDAGNATLKLGERMWTYTPKLNRTIRLPFSLMSQSWAGSDFSYNDLSRSDSLLQHYDLELTAVETQEGVAVYTIEAIPHDDAPVVWGKEEIVVRADNVLLRHRFFDQALEPVKTLETLEIGTLGGRTIGTRMRMGPVDAPDEYTEIHYASADFDVQLPERTFTQFALQNGGPDG
jgi:hypothetical protein